MPTPLRVQTDRAIYLAIKEQTDPDVLESGSGAELLRFAASSGFISQAGRVAPRESRYDGLVRRGRKGRSQVDFAVNNDLVIGAYNTPISAVLRNTMSAASSVDETTSSVGQITVSGSVVTFAGTSVLTLGVRKGQIHNWTTGLAAGDLNKNLVVIAATSNSITYHRALTTVGSATDFDFTIKKRVAQSNEDIAFTGEERRVTHGQSELCRYLRFTQWGLSLTPDSNIDINFNGIGLEKTLPAAGAANFSSPSVASGLGLIAPSAKFYIVGIGFVRMSAFNFSFDINASREDSIDDIAYEIIPGQPTINTQVTFIENNLDLEDAYLTQDVLEGFLLIEEPVPSGLAPSMAVWFNQFTLTTPAKSGLGADRSSTRTFNLDPDINESGGANVNSNIYVSTSA